MFNVQLNNTDAIHKSTKKRYCWNKVIDWLSKMVCTSFSLASFSLWDRARASCNSSSSWISCSDFWGGFYNDQQTKELQSMFINKPENDRLAWGRLIIHGYQQTTELLYMLHFPWLKILSKKQRITIDKLKISDTEFISSLDLTRSIHSWVLFSELSHGNASATMDIFHGTLFASNKIRQS